MEDVQTVVSDLSMEEANESIQDTLERIERNAGVKGGKPTVVRSVVSLDPVVRHFGLSPEQLTQLLDIVLAAKLDDATGRKLIKLLLPRQSVPEMCAIKVLGVLGRQLSYSIQATLLRWVILVYDIFDSRTKLQQLYGVAFHYLGYETLRLDLQITVGKEPALTGLLHVYKSYFPDLILAPLTLAAQTIFKCPDQATAEVITALQTKWSHRSNQSYELNGSKDPISRSGAKRQKLSHSSIPDAFSIYRKGADDKALPLSQIASLEALVGHIDTLALPDQLASVLSNRLLQHVLCLQPSHSIVERISYWLGQELMDLWYWNAKTDVTRARLATILTKVVQVTKMIKGQLILCYSKLVQNWAQFRWKDYLELGKDPRLSKQESDELRRLFSELSPNVDYMQSIRTFIKHVDNISGVALEMERDHIAVQHAVLSFFDFISNLTRKNSIPLAVIIPEAAIIYRCFLSDSAMAISRICGIVYQYKQAYEAFEEEQQLQYEILVQSQMSSQGGKDGEGGTMAALPAPLEVPGYTREYVVQFNSFVMDICNFLWRNRAFNKTDKNAKGFQMDQETIGHTRQVCVDSGLSMNNMLSITHSTALSGYSARFLKSLEEQNGVPVEKRLKAPASAKALKDMSANGGLNLTFDEYRIQYLDYLEEKGFEGVSQFLFDCITNLLQRKLQSQERQRELREMQQQQGSQIVAGQRQQQQDLAQSSV
ncbi:hypothetical protein BGX23_008881 [Mortierella sp. AD031]|nr:hypothetical protein BGX23_008881 [Mortierella sp. AD031]